MYSTLRESWDINIVLLRRSKDSGGYLSHNKICPVHFSSESRSWRAVFIKNAVRHLGAGSPVYEKKAGDDAHGHVTISAIL